MVSRNRVLVVSHDRELRERLRTGVFALGALPVLTGDPDQAVQIAVDTKPTAAIIDGQLAEADARVRPSSLRRVSSLSDAPIMVMASSPASGGLVRLGDEEEFTVLERSLDTASMAARLRMWLRARGAGAGRTATPTSISP